MENIEKLTHEELVQLVRTWYNANKEERSVVIMAGKKQGDGVHNTHLVCGRNIDILVMMIEFITDNPEIVERASFCSLMRKMRDAVKDKDEKSE